MEWLRPSGHQVWRYSAALQAAVPYLLFLMLAAALVVPASLSPRVHDSFWIDWVWADQFTAELRRGNLYPRWLPESHAGLGSPVFYFYPPLAFYTSGVLGLLGLSTYASIVGTFGIALFGSGAAMYFWLKNWTSSPIVGALFYMFAPYHMFDIYARGALAEVVAIAFIPLVSLGLRRIASGQSGTLLALSYGGLILSHLPLALLVSLLLIAPYACMLARKCLVRVAAMGLALSLGIGISAIYLVPALALKAHRDEAALWSQPIFVPQNWNLISLLDEGPLDVPRLVVALIVTALFIPATVLIVKHRSGWAAYAACCCLLVTGLTSFLWSLPLLRAVQFPFRVLPLAEFGLATALAQVTHWALRVRLTFYPALALSAYCMAIPPTEDAAARLETLRLFYPDVPENLPPGQRLYSFPSGWALEVAASHKTIKEVANRTVLTVFYFPAWNVLCDGRSVPTFPDPETKLLSFDGRGCISKLSWTAAEKVGALISLASFLLLIATVLGFQHRKSRLRTC